MYSIYAGDLCIYTDSFNIEDREVIDPKLSLEANTAGSLTFSLTPDNVGYSQITRLDTDILVTKDNKVIWSGRVLSDSTDFFNIRTFTCEGDLAFLNDTIQPQEEYDDVSIAEFLDILLGVHNQKVGSNRMLVRGAVTVTDPGDSSYQFTNYESTLECVNDKLVNRFGGYLRTRYENGIRYLDYLAEGFSNTQTIEFGSNLLDFKSSLNATDYVTAVIPLGARLVDEEESGDQVGDLERYLTVASENDGSIVVNNSEAVEAHGWIERVVHWDDVEDPSILKSKAEQYLSETQFDTVTITLSAIDLHYLNTNYEDIELLDNVRVISRPHGMDRRFMVKKLDIPLDRPEDTKFQLGDTVKTTLTSVNNAVNSEILKKIEELPKEKTILDIAKSNAAAIMDLATNGYITITKDDNGSEALYISDTQDLSQATKYWRWNVNGLAYYNRAVDGVGNPRIAMTMDGAISADFMTTGTMRVSNALKIISPKVGNRYLFTVDQNGAQLYNSKILIDTTDGNRFLIDPSGGLLFGPTSSFHVTDAGQIVIDDQDELLFFVDDNGNLKLKGALVGASATLEDAINVNDNFIVDHDGNVQLNGNILWGVDTSPVKALYARTELSKPNAEYSSYYSSSEANWHRTLDSDHDFYVSYNYSGGRYDAWTDPLRLQGEDGTPGSDASVTRDNIVDAFRRSIDEDGIYYDDDTDSLAIRATYIRGGVIDTDEGVYLGTSDYSGDPLIGFTVAEGDNGDDTTTGAKIYANGVDGYPYLFVSGSGIAAWTNEDEQIYMGDGAGVHCCMPLTMGYSGDIEDLANEGNHILAGLIMAFSVEAEEVITPSDRHLKRDISYDYDNYERFFNGLRPVSYNYTNDKSFTPKRLGFIAQDVEDALYSAGLTRNDFNGLGEKKKDDDTYFTLSYLDFVPLNTHMIQKLQSKVEALEQRITDLESRLDRS